MFYCFFQSIWSDEQTHPLLKLIKSGLHGWVINTLRSLYNEICFRVKHGGYASESIRQVVGVNQCGNASPIIFRKYMSDMRDCLDENTGVVLSKFCSKDKFIVNTIKSKCMIFGQMESAKLYSMATLLNASISIYIYMCVCVCGGGGGGGN